MADAPIKFRCYRCNKLLGVSARKAGSIVNCPECKAELQIPAPEPEPEPAAPDPKALDPAFPTDIAGLRPEDIRVEPEFANLVVDPIRARPAPKPPEPVQVVEPQETPPDVVEERPEPPAPVETFMPENAAEVVIPNIRFEPPSLAEPKPSGRAASEVVLAPTVVLAWSLLVLLAIPLAFLAGLLTGHFIWK